MPSSDIISQHQLDALDDTDCYASVWEQILSLNRSNNSNTNLWGGRGKGGRGLARRTVQPKDIIVEDVSLQYLGRPDAFLEGATIKLLQNHIYALIGRNGCGKSSLMKRMHNQKVPGWSPQWSSLYIPPELPTEFMKLSPLQVLERYYCSCKSDAKVAAESMITDLEKQIDNLDEEDEHEVIERLCEEMAELEDVMKFEDGFFEEKDLRCILQDIGIEPDGHCDCLLPSQQKEVMLLAASLFSQMVNLVLLDEPAGSLDVQGLLWLRRLIESASSTVLMVSHDVDLINDVATDIIDMQARKLHYYPGNYDSYRLMKEQRVTHALLHSIAMGKKEEKLKNTLQHLKEQPTSRRRGGAKKKAKAIASQKKKLDWHAESMSKLDPSAEILPQQRWRTVAERLKLAESMKKPPDKGVQFAFPPTTSAWGEPLILAYDVGFGTDEEAILRHKEESTYPIASVVDSGTIQIFKRDGFLFECVDICIEEGSINCLLGPDVCSSYLLQILAKQLAPVEGTVHHAPGVRVGYCSAQTIRELLSNADSSTTALDYLFQLHPHKTEKDIRGHLTLFGLSSTSQGKTPICFLSGGERFRFALAKITLDDVPVICMENPTVSLDVESVQALSYGLQHWNGTVVMTSVDAFFLRALQDIKCFVIVPEEGKLRRISSEMKGIDGYLKSVHLDSN